MNGRTLFLSYLCDEKSPIKSRRTFSVGHKNELTGFSFSGLNKFPFDQTS